MGKNWGGSKENEEVKRAVNNSSDLKVFLSWPLPECGNPCKNEVLEVIFEREWSDFLS